MIAMMNKVGKTVLGVNMGCHALSRCCLNAVSNRRKSAAVSLPQRIIRTCWSLPPALLLFWLWSLVTVCACLLAPCAAVEKRHGGR